ncbi:DnaJ domain-containing protein [Rhodococcus pyridinivorans]|uniref:J domain-containing protein n=1 Tax=Rhodococcus pyridinivorans TaxID=103816 RepID=UPI00280B5BC6|nr:DnaJ domain-containing protein [Rhodococcus pyridinivorans]WMM74440.1 DnaJ domain-containing protein [Rhodococcus pyridinivorans]
MTQAFPLQWPEHWPRTEHPRTSQFKVSQHQAQQGLRHELALLGARDIVVSTNIELRRDGLPYASRKAPKDQGVAVYFTLNGEQQCIPCDKWVSVGENMRAIEKTVEALRGLERWGAKEMVNAAFRGFKALPAEAIVTPYTAKPWHEVLEVSPTASIETIRAAYRSMLHRHHPDKGGSEGDFLAVQRAWDQAQKVVS